MDIILLEKIDNLGGIGDKVVVKPGYARNYLIPQGKATVATARESRQVRGPPCGVGGERPMGELEAGTGPRRAKFEGQVIKMSERTPAPRGKLFGSVGTHRTLPTACQRDRVWRSSAAKSVRLPEGSDSRLAGEHQIELHFHTGVDVPVTVVVEGQDGEAWVDDEDQSDTNESSESAESTEAEGAEQEDDT